MGEIEQRLGTGEPQTRDSLLEAQTYWSLKVYLATNKAHREAVQKAVAETQAITDEQVLLFVAPFLTESTRQLGNHLLQQQEQTLTHIEQVVAEYRRRSGGV